MLRLLQLIFILVIHGFWVFGNHQWIQRADFGNIGRHRAVSVAIGNNAYAGTGHQNGNGIDTWYPDWWEYDPATNAWSQKADYPGNNGNGDQDIVALGFDSVCYAGLGQIDGTRLFKYSPMTNQWTQVASPPSNGDFNNTFPFRIGDFGYFPSLYSSNFFRFDPLNNQWQQMNPLPQSTVYGIPTFGIGDYGYIKYGNAFYQYDPTVDSWTPKAAFPGLYPHRPTMINHLGYGYTIGGYQGSPSSLPWEWSNEVWRYDPDLDEWTQMENYEFTTRRWAVACNVNERVFYGLGTNGTNFNDWWEFVPTLGMEEKEMEVSVYPNPSANGINVRVESNDALKLELYSLAGNKMIEQDFMGSTYIQRSELASGVYFIHLLKDGKVISNERVIFE